MARNIRVVGVKRREVDADRLALAYLMLATSRVKRRKANAAANQDEDTSADRESA